MCWAVSLQTGDTVLPFRLDCRLSACMHTCNIPSCVGCVVRREQEAETAFSKRSLTLRNVFGFRSACRSPRMFDEKKRKMVFDEAVGGILLGAFFVTQVITQIFMLRNFVFLYASSVLVKHLDAPNPRKPREPRKPCKPRKPRKPRKRDSELSGFLTQKRLPEIWVGVR